jgi:hypothetical protein
MSETPFREASVPMSKYVEMENDLKTKLENKTKELEEWKKAYSEKAEEFREYKKEDKVDIVKNLAWTILTFGALCFVVFKGCQSCNRNDPGGEAAIINAETSLRKHMRGMNNTVSALSCRVSSTNELNPNCSNNYRFCQISYRSNNSNTVSNAYYCCDNAYAEYSNGCIEVKAGSDAGVISDANR